MADAAPSVLLLSSLGFWVGIFVFLLHFVISSSTSAIKGPRLTPSNLTGNHRVRRLRTYPQRKTGVDVSVVFFSLARLLRTTTSSPIGTVFNTTRSDPTVCQFVRPWVLCLPVNAEQATRDCQFRDCTCSTIVVVVVDERASVTIPLWRAGDGPVTDTFHGG